MDKKRKSYQHDGEAMELLLRFLDRKQGAVHREYWGECSSATPPQTVGVREDKKVNKLITSYDCQAITVFFKSTKKHDWLVVLIAVLFTSPSAMFFKKAPHLDER